MEISGKTADVTDVQVTEVVDCWFIEHGPEGDCGCNSITLKLISFNRFSKFSSLDGLIPKSFISEPSDSGASSFTVN